MVLIFLEEDCFSYFLFLEVFVVSLLLLVSLFWECLEVIFYIAPYAQIEANNNIK